MDGDTTITGSCHFHVVEWSVRVVVALALVATTLAGCSEPEAAAGPPALELAEVDNSVTRGSISGVVVDEAIRPIAGVNLTLLGPQLTVASNEGGQFIFEDLDPGLYTVSAAPLTAADGRLFLGIQTTAEVVAGQTAKVRMVLPPDPTPQPYHTIYKWDAYDEVNAGIVDGGYEIVRTGFANDTLPPLCDQCAFFFHPEGPAHTFLFEAVWEESIEDPTDGETSYYWVLEDVEGEADYSDDYCTSPCYVPIDATPYANVTTLSISVYPDEDWVAYQQRWQMFMTVWYLAPPPEGWSVVAGDT